MAAQSLPNETLTSIFENLQACDLVPVLQASDRFRLVAERVLYTNIFILDQLTRVETTPTKSLTFCDTLTRRKHLTDVPRKLGIRWTIDGGSSADDYIEGIQPALLALNRALYALPQLETLELALGLSGAGISVPTVLESCTFPALRIFALSGIGRGLPPLKGPLYQVPPSATSTSTSDPADSPTSSSASAARPPLTIEHFLIATPSIQHLRLADHYGPLRLPHSALPQLFSFRGHPMAAASVCPGRAIQRLALVGGDYIAPADIAAIAQTSTQIVMLDLSSMSVTPSLLQALSQQINCVVTLRVRLALRHTLHFALSGIVSRSRRYFPLRAAIIEPEWLIFDRACLRVLHPCLGPSMSCCSSICHLRRPSA